MTARARRKALPTLAASLRWYKREAVRGLRRKVEEFRHRFPKLSASYADRLRRVRAMPPAAFRDEYLAHRAAQVDLWDLRHQVAGLGRVFRVLGTRRA